MSDQVTFRVRTRPVTYGDNRTFHEYSILMYARASLVGYEEGPRRTTESLEHCLKEARKRVRELRSHRLFVIRVTRQHITDGEARNCHTCAISQALWHNQERMGFEKSDFSFEVSPYGGIGADPRGIVLSHKWGEEEDRHIPADVLPDLVSGQRGKIIFNETMGNWAANFDEWAESRYMSLPEWRDLHGFEDGERPWRPSPASFVLDLDAFRPT